MAILLPLRSSLHARVGDKRLSGTHRSSCCGELREATTASRVDEKIIYVVQGQAWKVQFAGDIGVLNTLQNKADNKTFYGSKNLIHCDLCAIMTLQSSIAAKVSANAPMLRLLKSGATITWICLRVMSREEISSPPSSYHHKL